MTETLGSVLARTALTLSRAGVEQSMFKEAGQFAQIQGQDLQALLTAEQQQNQSFANSLAALTGALTKFGGTAGGTGQSLFGSGGSGAVAASSATGLSTEADAATSGDSFSGISGDALDAAMMAA